MDWFWIYRGSLIRCLGFFFQRVGQLFHPRMNGHMFRRFDAKPHTTGADFKNRNLDVVSNNDLLILTYD